MTFLGNIHSKTYPFKPVSFLVKPPFNTPEHNLRPQWVYNYPVSLCCINLLCCVVLCIVQIFSVVVLFGFSYAEPFSVLYCILICCIVLLPYYAVYNVLPFSCVMFSCAGFPKDVRYQYGCQNNIKTVIILCDNRTSENSISTSKFLMI